MVKGLDIFLAHFRAYADRYILIGGTACDIAMAGAGLPFRATKDLDIVLIVEALDSDFLRAFWEFVRAGGYQVQEESTGQKQLYRFQKPTNETYPFMLELFSRQPDILEVAEGSHLTPLPVGEDLSSLSAILMDEDYYRFILAGRTLVDGLPVVDAAHLVPLKARAWLDLTQREKNGEQIDSRTIKKHKNDVFRLYQILDPNVDPGAPEFIKAHMREFIARMAGEEVDLKALGIRSGTRDTVLAELTTSIASVNAACPWQQALSRHAAKIFTPVRTLQTRWARVTFPSPIGTTHGARFGQPLLALGGQDRPVPLALSWAGGCISPTLRESQDRQVWISPCVCK